MKRYNTSIKKLIEAQKTYDLTHQDNAIFLSNWDSELENLTLPEIDIKDIKFENEYIGSYYYWTDEHNYKPYVQKYYKETFQSDLHQDTFIIGSNGSASIMLSLMALKELSIKKVLAITPLYFSTLNLLELLEYQMYRFDLDIYDDFAIDLEKLEYSIKKNNIEIIFITDPIFSSGIEISEYTYHQIFDICKKNNVWVVIDYIYGGMNWNGNNFIFSSKIKYIIENFTNYILVESIAKRLFINGIKTAITFSDPQIIRKIARLSIYTVGSMCCLQLEMLSNIYNSKNSKQINNLIKQSIITASSRFNRIQALMRGKKCIISPCNNSYFFLMGIPYLEKMDDINYAITILNQIGVLTVPHSRYLLYCREYYVFRVNLLIDEKVLFEGLSKLSYLI